MRSSIVLVLFLLSAGFAQPPKSKSISLRGNVYADDTGAPAATAYITLLEDVYGTRTVIGRTTGDERGTFMFANLHPGSYTLQVEKEGFLTKTVVEIADGRDVAVRLERAATVSGRVMDNDGRAVENALIEVTSRSYVYGQVTLISSGLARADSQGQYRVSNLSPGRYYVRASCDGYKVLLYPSASGLSGAQAVDLIEGSNRHDISFHLDRTRLFRLSGNLIDAETKSPARAAFLRAFSADPVAGTFVDGFVHEGQFRIDGMEPGRYFLKFVWVGATNNVQRTVIFPFEMGHADQTDVFLTAMPRGRITGHLKTGKEGIPPGVTVTLVPADVAINAHIGGNGTSAEVREDGTFEMTAVEAGEYRLGIHAGAPPRFFVKDRAFTVDGRSSITGVELELVFSAGTVIGRALDSAGEIIPSALVVLQSTDMENRPVNQYRHIVRANKRGEYSITGVIPGDYFLFVWKGDPGLIGAPDLFAEAGERATRLRVSSRAKVLQDATILRN